MNTEQFEKLHRLCLLTMLEVIHLKKLLSKNNLIQKDNDADYSNALTEYMDEINRKQSMLIRTFPDLDPRQANRK